MTARLQRMSFLLLAIPSVALAHFRLDQPTSWMSQDGAGLPQKGPPCGDEGGGTPTGVVTAFQEGQTITVAIREIIFHPGHYRIALATTDRSQLPADPPVTAGATPCGSVPIESPPVFPVLADDVFDHTQQFPFLPDGGDTPQYIQIQLPAGVTCTKCTLQIVEFMSDHVLNPIGGCFYHHCADLSVVAVTPTDGGTPNDAGSTGQPDSGSTGQPDAGSSSQPDAATPGADAGSGGAAGGSCGCSGVGSGAWAALLGLILVAAGVRRRAAARLS
jgi:uncharacterized protein (TIGR03382 family)